MKRGVLLALEGIDGSGKTTQMTLLTEHLRSQGHTVHQTVEPSNGPVGRLVRQALGHNPTLDEATLALLFAADRLDHLSREIEPKLRDGAVVLTDRYLLSSMAYQSTFLPLPWITDINSRARRPDASVLLEVTPELAARRRRRRGTAEEHFEGLQRQKRLAEAYAHVAQREDVGRCVVIDAARDVATVEAELCAQVDALLASLV